MIIGHKIITVCAISNVTYNNVAIRQLRDCHNAIEVTPENIETSGKKSQMKQYNVNFMAF